MKLPDYRALGGLPPVSGSQRIPHYSTDGFVADVGKGIRDLGAGISSAGAELQKNIDKEKNEADTLQRAQADADFRIGSMKSLDEAANDPDYEGASQKFRDNASQHLETAAGNIADPQAKELFRIKGRAQIEQDAFRLDRITEGRRRDEVISNNDTRLEELGKRAVVAPDEKSQAAIIQEGNQLIEGQVRAGYYSPAQAAAKRKAFTENFATQVYADKIERDPRGVLDDFKKLEGAQAAPAAGQPAAAPGAPEAAPRDYGSLTLPFSVPSFAKATVLDKLEKSGVVDQLPKPLQDKIKAGAEGDAPLTLTKQDLDSIPAGPWKTIAKELKPLGVPEPKDAPAAAKATASPIQIAKQFEGLNEREHRSVIADFIEKSAGKKIDPAQTAWCAAFVNAVLGESGRGGTGSLMARSFLKYGKETNEPTEGDIVVLTRGDPNGPYGHVGFYAGRDENGNVKVLAGNQGNAVSTRSFPESQVLGYRKPPEAGTPIAGIETAPAPAKSGTLLDFIPADKLMVIRRKAEAKAWEVGATERATVEKGMEDDLMSVRQTGDGPRVDPNNIARAFGSKGPEKAVEYQETRRLNRDFWANTSDFSRMTSDQISERVAALEPKPGPGMAYQATLRDEVKKEADRIVKLRNSDPAEAVSSDPLVQEAAKKVDPNNPETVKQLGAARVAAQARLGIDVAPVTVKEAGRYAGMLDQAANDPRRLRDLADATVDKIVADWGEQLAPAVFATVMQRYKIDKESSAAMYAILNKRGLNAPVTPEDFEQLRNSLDLDARARAMDWGDRTRPMPGSSQAPAAAPAKGKAAEAEPSATETARNAATKPQPQGDFTPGKTFIPPQDIGALRRKEIAPADFDAKYGRGAAQAVIKARGIQ